MYKILITGSQGFLGTYMCQEFLNNHYQVIGVDDFSKYGAVLRPHDSHQNFKLYTCDVRDPEFQEIVVNEQPDFIIAGAALIGGISYFHKYAYDLLAANERILAATFDAAINLYKKNILKRILVISSSMVFENTNIYPTPEHAIAQSPPPFSTYGFQKLASEYFALGAWEQYGLPYTIMRPFNCVGIGEEEALGAEEVLSGNIKLMMSHVLPDLVNKIIKGQDPLHILGNGSQIRCYTNGKDIGRAARMIIESDKAFNEDFNISVAKCHSVDELANIIWQMIYPDKPLRLIYDPPFKYDVQKRIPDVNKAKNILGFEANITLQQSIEEVINYVRNH